MPAGKHTSILEPYNPEPGVYSKALKTGTLFKPGKWW
jgi:hypothetical protein